MDRMTAKSAHRALAHLATYGTPPNAETANALSVGLEKTLETLQNEVFPQLKAGGSDILFVYGPNGRGKTHFLLSMERAALQESFVIARVDCSHGNSPFESLRDTYEQLVNSMSVGASASAQGDKGIQAIVEAAIELSGNDGMDTLISRLKNSRHLAPEVRNLTVAYVRALSDPKATQSLKNQLEFLLSGSQNSLIQLSALYRSHKDLPRPLGKITKRNSAHWLRSLLSLPAALGFSGLVVLFDETERRGSKGSRGESYFQLANLRNIVDYCALGALDGCYIVYAAADDFLERAKQNLDALSQRIEPPSLLQGKNPSSLRAAWADLDDLTSPHPENPKFFVTLADRIGELALAAGVSQATHNRAIKRLHEEAKRYSRSPQSGVVREFVKLAALELQASRT